MMMMMIIIISFHAIIFRSRTVSASQTCAKTEFNAKYPVKVIQGHAFWDRWEADDGLRI